ncbi:MAG: 50S ribosomal protein L3 [Gammaproteobacteria bacterium]|nr:MAG: 50S ribosomal protein L3 [Gammaproteobacteria bacterium]
MALGLIGKKCGMMRVFTEEGASVPVTVIEIPGQKAVQIKTKESDQYSAVQVAVGTKKQSHVNKAIAGHYAKHKVEPGYRLCEFRVDEDELPETGSELDINLFTAGDKVDVTGTSIGKGYAGVIKRHNFSMQDATHGNSKAHRAFGSIGQCQTPGRVFKGKKMSGHMGNVKRTTQNLEVIRVDSERKVILVKGSVPGSKGSDVIIKKSIKSR